MVVGHAVKKRDNDEDYDYDDEELWLKTGGGGTACPLPKKSMATAMDAPCWLRERAYGLKLAPFQRSRSYWNRVDQMIELTDSAVGEVKRLLEQEGKENWGLRVGVVGGGCSGLSYTLAFDDEPNADDAVDEVAGIRVFVDPKSALFLSGMKLDFSRELLTGGFKFHNPNAVRSCSCGTSFSA